MSSAAKVLRVLSPTRLARTPPWLGMALANSARVLAALEDASMTSGLIPSISLEYSTNFGAKAISSSPNAARDVPPVSQEVSPSATFTPVRIKSVSAKDLTPLIASPSTPLTASKKGWALVMN